MAAKFTPSIIPQSTETQCYFCGKKFGLCRHHCLHGRGIRKLAEEDGLWIWICDSCHNMTNESVHLDPEHKKDKFLQHLAQETLIKQYMKQGYPEDVAREMFLSRYGRFFNE